MLSREIHKHDRLSLYLLNGGGGGPVHDLEDFLAGDKTSLLGTQLTYWQLLGSISNPKLVLQVLTGPHVTRQESAQASAEVRTALSPAPPPARDLPLPISGQPTVGSQSQFIIVLRCGFPPRDRERP